MREKIARHLCAASQDDWRSGKAYWLTLADQVLAITRDSDRHPNGRRPKGSGSEATRARAEGIAMNSAPYPIPEGE